ncbi:GDSL esterase/lipase [Heracleum sosnowskyi]|uniref:GDSL esterase/lipase n=1 Tax=Heracleum sosnowskyi TaxID=360622 RepID=A0AAD8JA44_9APIA|nr:GDSL esterase/lipase [Heracleum sosnowskyi]
MATSIFLSFIFIVQLFNIFLTCNSLPKFSSILVFGDSLVDTGNNNFLPLSVLKANHYPYGESFPGGIATGRFSDGKLMSDFLAEALGLKQTVPPFTDPNLPQSELPTGVCFASAGSGYDDTTSETQVIPVTQQYQTHFKSYKQRLIGMVGELNAKNILQNSLVFSVAGSNDVALNYYANPAAIYFHGTMDEYQNALIDNIQTFIKSLYEDGCRNMAIAGLPPVCNPLDLGGLIGCLFNKGSDANVYNTKLQAMLTELQPTLPGSKLVYADIFTPMEELALNPFLHGIQYPIGPGCCGNGLFPRMGPTCDIYAPLCGNPSNHFFWDAVHPTQTVYRYMSDYLITNVLPQFN